jgi:hypothetical protein
MAPKIEEQFERLTRDSDLYGRKAVPDLDRDVRREAAMALESLNRRHIEPRCSKRPLSL